ncbi:MAG TPA: cytochrome c [Cyclobacteriaceae bacterium]|nr:cytochrome c [Cyclobacteriaceae bacterium]HMV10611.1 cytochrome c [Cyclobacteriaceae bacterium]HMV89931.1 cytochrome c [Cyclobacteriaceae bacterium]HMX02598.1 cytochrome c [Cyclobacteriaceae bacterium]HMX50903.1 cytochrome c [Cyclobacteriaceae bacterium]
MQVIKRLIIGFAGTALLASCGAGGDDQGTEYAPNMYHSVAYEPYTQITDKEAGRWVTSIEYTRDSSETNFSDHAEYHNSNYLNPFHMNMRLPAPNTVSRNKNGYLPYRLKKDSLQFAAATLVSPLDTAAANAKVILAEGKILYETYCDHCHGAKGEGDGKVADKYAGVANLKGDAIRGVSEGHIFHVITMGKGLMQPHGSQVSPEDRWKIARYVKSLQAAK